MHHLQSVIIKIDGATVDDAEYLDLVLPMPNLLEYSGTTGCLCPCSKDEVTNLNTDIVNNKRYYLTKGVIKNNNAIIN